MPTPAADTDRAAAHARRLSRLAGLYAITPDLDDTPHHCVAQYGTNLPLLPKVTIPPFERSGDYDPAPSAAEVAKLCDASVAAGQANYAAARVDCPTLDRYHLFADPEDPRSAPNGGVPFVLTTKLFSDYSVKYRVAYLPPGTQATYSDKASNGVDYRYPLTLRLIK